MKRLITLSIVSLLLSSAQAQVRPPASAESDISEVVNAAQIKKPLSVVDTNASCSDADVMPEFIGGMNALFNYLNKSITYPPEAKKKGIKGRVVARFLMNRYGKAQHIKITQSLSPECDAEVVRVLTEMPAWRPATKDGDPVNITYTLPITFN